MHFHTKNYMLINISKSILHITYLKLFVLVKLCIDLMYAKYCSNLAIIIITVKYMLPLPPIYPIVAIYNFFKIFKKRKKNWAYIIPKWFIIYDAFVGNIIRLLKFYKCMKTWKSCIFHRLLIDFLSVAFSLLLLDKKVLKVRI